MNMKKMVSCLVAGSMLTMAVSAFAQIPETQVSTINNAAVVAFDGVNAHRLPLLYPFFLKFLNVGQR